MPDMQKQSGENVTNNKTFVRITNKDVYKKLVEIDHKIDTIRGTVSWHSKAIAVIFVILGVMIGALI